jgi:WD40 repeat protein
LASSRIVHRIQTTAGPAFVALTPTGDLLAARSGDGAGVWDTTSWEQVATFTEPEAIAVAGAFSPAGDRVAVAYEPLTETAISPVVVYDLGGGPAVSLATGDPHPFPEVEFASGGDIVVANRFDAESGRAGFGKWSATTGEFLGPLGDGLGPLDVDLVGERVATIPDDRFRIHDIASGAVLVDDGGGSGYVSVAFSPTGTRVAEVSQDLFSLRIRDAATGTVLLDAEVERIAGVAWLDESRVAVGGELVRVVDAGSGEVLAELAGHEGGVWNLAAIPNTDRLATQGFDGAVLIWDVTPFGLPELPSIDTGLLDPRFHWSGPGGSIVMRERGTDSLWVLEDGGSQPEPVMAGLVGFSTYSTDGSHNAFTRTDGTSGVVRVADGEVVYDAPEGLHALGVSNDAGLVVLAEPWDVTIQWEQVPLVVDTATGETVGELTPPLDRNYTISPDSSLVSHVCCGAPNSSAYVLPGGEPTGDFGTFGSFFSPSGSLLAYPLGDSGLMWLIDTDRLKETKDLESAQAAFIDAHDGSIFGAFSADESMMVTSTFGEPIRVWDIAGVLDGVEPRLIAEIDAQPRIGPPSTTFSPDGKHIVARSIDGVLLRFTIDTDELISIARSRLTRDLTADECATFGIDPCPTS